MQKKNFEKNGKITERVKSCQALIPYFKSRFAKGKILEKKTSESWVDLVGCSEKSTHLTLYKVLHKGNRKHSNFRSNREMKS